MMRNRTTNDRVSSDDTLKISNLNNKSNCPSTVPFIAVHNGAGYHDPKLFQKYKKLCNKACEKGMSILISSVNSNANQTSITSNSNLTTAQTLAVQSVEEAIKVLEDSTLSNAGIASNLSRYGTVETDASIMCGKTGSFGAVCAVENLKNPIIAARHVMANERNRLDQQLGRVKPMMIASDHGVKRYLKGKLAGDEIQFTNLITEDQYQRWQHYKSMLDSIERKEETHYLNDNNINNKINYNKRKLESSQNENENGNEDKKLSSTHFEFDNLQDTVGAVAVDSQGNFAAGVSSGGIWLKETGRIGEAGHFGSGIWADNGKHTGHQEEKSQYHIQPRKKQRHSICMSTTGTGEQIMKSLFASKLSNKLSKSKHTSLDIPHVVDKFMNKDIMEHSWFKSFPNKHIGFIAYRGELENSEDVLSDNPCNISHKISQQELENCDDKQNGKENESKTIVGGDFIYGHTTNSMCFSWMTGNDTTPHFKLSRKKPNKDRLVGIELIR